MLLSPFTPYFHCMDGRLFIKRDLQIFYVLQFNATKVCLFCQEFPSWCKYIDVLCSVYENCFLTELEMYVKLRIWKF